MSKHLSIVPDGEFLLYQTEAGLSRIEVRMQGEMVWLTQNQMAEMFRKSKQNISQQVKAIYDSGELKPAATHKKFLLVSQEGSRQANRQLELYNFDMIISVGYRGSSIRGTQFRIWATKRLREYIIKGFVMDDERLKEAIRSGFKKAWQESNYGSIIVKYPDSAIYEEDSAVTGEVERFLSACLNEMSRRQLQDALGLKLPQALPGAGNESWFGRNDHPDKPNSRLQKYRLTGKGRVLVNDEGGMMNDE